MVASITSNAATAFSNALFDKVDTKKQGYIDADELTSALGSDATAVFKQIDGDSDGKISKSELSAATEKAFSALRAQQHQGGHVHKGGKPEGPPPPPPPADSQSSDPADSNGDGTVSQSEQAAYESKPSAQSPLQHKVDHALSLLKAYFEQTPTTSQVSTTA